MELQAAGSKEERLLKDTLGNDEVEALLKEGFKQEDIMEAKLLAERVMFQLEQIVAQDGAAGTAPGVETANPIGVEERQEEDLSLYIGLAGKIDESAAVKFMLKLKSDFGSFERVLDEYLFTLQADMDLEDYLTDRAAYTKQKEEKSLAGVTRERITMAMIEEKLLEKIQASNKGIKPGSRDISENLLKPENSAAGAEVPQIPVPVIEDVKPKNPAEEIMNEIKQISPVQNVR